MADGTQSAGTITDTLGTCTVTSANGNTTACYQNQILNWGDTIHTGSDGRARGTLYDGSIVSLGSNSDLQVNPNEAQSSQNWFQRWAGQVRAWVASWTRRGGGYEIKTPGGGGPIGTVISPDGQVIDPNSPITDVLTCPDGSSTQIDGDNVNTVDADSYIDPNLDPADPNNWYTDIWEYDFYSNLVYYYGAGGGGYDGGGGGYGGGGCGDNICPEE